MSLKDESIRIMEEYTGMKLDYKVPGLAEKSQIADLVLELEAVERTRDFSKLIECAELLGLEVSKCRELPDALLLYPKDFGQLFVVWNLDSKAHPFVLSYQHAGTDDVDELGIQYMLSCNYKALVVNGLHAYTSDKPSELEPTRKITDGCNSGSTWGIIFLDEVINKAFKLKQFGLVSIHGHRAEESFKLRYSNCVPEHQFNTSVKNFPFLLCVATALEEEFQKFRFQATSEHDNLMVSGRKLCSTTGKKCFLSVEGPATDIPIHLVNAGSITSDKGTCTGRAVHIEHAINFSSKNLHLLVAIHNRALKWFRKWDNNFHRYENIPEDLEDFDSWIHETKKCPAEKDCPFCKIVTSCCD